ncbi:MAG: flagellar hook-length control protein FliK [Planctomycetota bacterium]
MMVQFLEKTNLAGMGAAPAAPAPSAESDSSFREFLEVARREPQESPRREPVSRSSERAPPRDSLRELSEGEAESGAAAEPVMDGVGIVGPADELSEALEDLAATAFAIVAPLASREPAPVVSGTIANDGVEASPVLVPLESMPMAPAESLPSTLGEGLSVSAPRLDATLATKPGTPLGLPVVVDATTNAANPTPPPATTGQEVVAEPVVPPKAPTSGVSNDGATRAPIALPVEPKAGPTQQQPLTAATTVLREEGPSSTAPVLASVFQPGDSESGLTQDDGKGAPEFFLLATNPESQEAPGGDEGRPAPPVTAGGITSATPRQAPVGVTPDVAPPPTGIAAVDSSPTAVHSSPLQPSSGTVDGGRVAGQVVSADMERDFELSQKLYRIVRRTVREGGGEVRLRLDPPELGRVDLDVKLRGGRVDIAFRVDDELVRSVILRDIDELHRTLAGYGLEADGCTVELREPNVGDQGERDRRGTDVGAAGATASPEGEADAAAVRVLRALHLGAQLDCVA